MFAAICSSHTARRTSQAQASASRNRPFMEKFCFIFHLIQYLWSGSAIRLIWSSYLCGFCIEDGQGRWLWGGGTAFTDTVLPYRARAEMSCRHQGGHQPAWGPAEKHGVASILMWYILPRAVSLPNTTDMQTSFNRPSPSFWWGEMKSFQESAFSWESWMKSVSWLKIHMNSLLLQIGLKKK